MIRKFKKFKFRMKHDLVLVHSRTNAQFELDKSKFAQVSKVGVNFQKIQNSIKFIIGYQSSYRHE